MRKIARVASFIGFFIVFGSHNEAVAAVSACSSLTALIEDSQREPLFLVSFPKETSSQLNQVAFLYDNSVAAIALVSCGEVSKAQRIANAILWAQEHDRYWHDGRLRNAYIAGDADNLPLKLPGWWDKTQNRWVEDQYQVGSDSGNLAWAMLALISVYRASGDAQYLKGAERLGLYLKASLDKRIPRGFTGGTFGDEPSPATNTWKSTEHNVDLAAAFGQLLEATGDLQWKTLSTKARRFIDAMWSARCGCFAAGTAEDGKTLNHLIALDAQLWPLLAVPDGLQRYRGDLVTAKRVLTYEDGFAYSQAKEGVWTEGTAQAALLMKLVGEGSAATSLLAATERSRTPEGGYYAARSIRAPTGFMLQTDPSKPRRYFHIPHLAALAWVALAEQGFNPFTGKASLPK